MRHMPCLVNRIELLGIEVPAANVRAYLKAWELEIVLGSLHLFDGCNDRIHLWRYAEATSIMLKDTNEPNVGACMGNVPRPTNLDGCWLTVRPKSSLSIRDRSKVSSGFACSVAETVLKLDLRKTLRLVSKSSHPIAEHDRNLCQMHTV